MKIMSVDNSYNRPQFQALTIEKQSLPALREKGQALVGGAADVANQIKTGNYSGAVNSGIQILKGGRKLVDDTRNLGQQAMDQASTAVDKAHRTLNDKVAQFKAAAKGF